MKVSQTSSILCSILCLRFWRRLTEDWVSLCSTLFFSCPRLWIFSRHIDFVDTHLQPKQNLNFHLELFWPVWYCDENEWDPGGMRSKLSHSFTLSSPLGNKRLNFLSVQLPPAWMKGSDKQTRILKLEYQMRTEERTPTRSRVEAARQGRGRLDYFFLYFFLL